MHKFHKRRDFLSKILPLPFGEFPNPPIYIFHKEMVLLKEKTNSIYVRVTEKEKAHIQNNAKKCGLSVSEYLRKRALGYSPKPLLPETFYEFIEKIGVLHDALGTLGYADLQLLMLKLLDDIYIKLLVIGAIDKKSGGDE